MENGLCTWDLGVEFSWSHFLDRGGASKSLLEQLRSPGGAAMVDRFFSFSLIEN
jgi:hypothetical protein